DFTGRRPDGHQGGGLVEVAYGVGGRPLHARVKAGPHLLARRAFDRVQGLRLTADHLDLCGRRTGELLLKRLLQAAPPYRVAHAVGGPQLLDVLGGGLVQVADELLDRAAVVAVVDALAVGVGDRGSGRPGRLEPQP